MNGDTAMLVGLSCTICDAPVEAILASAETDRVGASQIAATAHERRFGHVPQKLRYHVEPMGLPVGPLAFNCTPLEGGGACL